MFLGDSITNLTRGQIAQQQPSDGFDQVEVLARNGATIADMHAALLLHRGYDPRADVIVIELGANDAGDDNSRAGRDLEHLMESVETSPCIVLVTVDSQVKRGNPVADQLNTQMRSLSSSADNVHLADWEGVVRAWPQRWRELTTDAVHPNDEGQRLLAELMWSTVTRSCERTRPSPVAAAEPRATG